MFQKFTRVERLSWNNYNEGLDLIDQIEQHKERYGTYPEVVCADKIYRTRTNVEYCTAVLLFDLFTNLILNSFKSIRKHQLAAVLNY